jgi:hypothetical protein
LEENGVVTLHINIGDVLQIPFVTNWRERFLHLLEILLEVSQLETNEQVHYKPFQPLFHRILFFQRATIEKDISKFWKQAISLEVDWKSLVQTDQYKSLDPTTQMKIIKTSNTKLLR